MSVKLMAQLWEHQTGSTGEQLVLLSLADFADDNGNRIYPSVDYVAWRVGISRRSVQRILSDLRTRGVLIEVKPSTPVSPTRYKMVIDQLPQKPAFEGGDNMSRGDTGVTLGVTQEPEGVTPVSPNPSCDPSEEPSSCALARTTTDSLDQDSSFRDEFERDEDGFSEVADQEGLPVNEGNSILDEEDIQSNNLLEAIPVETKPARARNIPFDVLARLSYQAKDASEMTSSERGIVNRACGQASKDGTVIDWDGAKIFWSWWQKESSFTKEWRFRYGDVPNDNPEKVASLNSTRQNPITVLKYWRTAQQWAKTLATAPPAAAKTVAGATATQDELAASMAD